MELVIAAGGTVRSLYDEALPLAALGSPVIVRASHVEPTESGHWLADLGPVEGPLLGPFEKRSEALAAEQDWLLQHWLKVTPHG